MNRRAAIIVAGMLMVGSVVAGAPAASAAAPRCTGTGHRLFVRPDGSLDNQLWILFPAHSYDTQVYGGTGYWSCSLVPGMTNSPGVYDMQATLNQCYPGIIGDRLAQDGNFGSKTKAALVKVQQWHGIEANGQYGPQTARTIYYSYNDWGPGPSGGCLTLTDFGWPGNSG